MYCYTVYLILRNEFVKIYNVCNLKQKLKEFHR